MIGPRGLPVFLSVVAGLAGVSGCSTVQSSSLSAWNEGEVKSSLIEFVDRVSDEGGPEYVAPADRIAVFDNDGTLWAEQPVYFQLFFAMDRIRALASEHPEWRTQQPYAAAIEGDLKAVAAGGKEAILELVMASHSGMTTDEFAESVRSWVTRARHPTSGRPYTEMVYEPMLQLLDYLRASGFQTYIVSGGGIEFMRVFAEEVYGVPPEQVIGSTIKTEFAMTGEGPEIRRLPELDFIDDGPGKPVAIQKFIGRRPILAGGNSDGDQQMLQWAAAGDGASLCLLVHHTDAVREWAYDRDSHIGRLDAALDEALSRGWSVVDMQQDWARVFGE